MKTEDFDDAIRRKIESINPQFEEKEIDKVHNYVSRNRDGSLWLSRRNLVFASLFILTVAGLLTWNFSQREERNQLIQTIDTLRKNIALAESHASVVKPDTSHITHPVNESVLNPAGEHAQSSAKQNANGNKDNSTVDNSNASQSKMAYRKLSSEEKLINKYESAANEFAASSKVSETKKINSTPVENKQDSMIATDARSRSHEDAGNANNMPADIAGQSAKNNVNKSITKQDSDVTINNQNTASMSSGVAASDTLPADKKQFRKQSHFLNNVHYEAGVGYEVANASTGYSVNGEAILNQKWSVSVGVQLVQLGNELFDDDDDFHHKKGQDFSNAYPSDVTDTSSLSNIHIHTTLIRIPVKLYYHVALKHNYSLLFGAGTDMDVYAMERVGYNHKDNTNMVIPKNFNAMPSTLLFNNATLSAGIEKGWRRYVFRAEPFISPQITDVDYKNVNLYFGIGIKVFYVI